MKDLIQTIVTNVTGSIKTTIFGCILFAAGLVSFFWTELGFGFWPPIELMVIGLVVVCLRDPRKSKNTGKKNGGGALPLIAILIAVMVTGCATERRCSERYGASSYSDSVRVEIRETVRDTVIHIPGDSVHIYLQNPCDSTGNLIPGVYMSNGKGNKASSIVEISKDGVEVICLCDEENRLITQLKREVNHLQSEKSETKLVYKERVSFWQLVGICVIVWLIGFAMGRISKKHFLS